MVEGLAGRRVLVTGGAGFVGANIVARLCEQGADVVVLDDFYTGNETNLPQGNARLRVVKGSVNDFALIKQVMADVPLVIHAAARNIIASTRNPKEDYETNIGGTLNILLAARHSRVERVLYTSSASI